MIEVASDDAGSLLIVIAPPDEAVRVFAVEGGGPEAVASVPAAGLSGAAVYALSVACSLAEIGLVPGAVPVGASGVALPKIERVRVLRLPGRAWDELADVPPDVRQIRLESIGGATACLPCPNPFVRTTTVVGTTCAVTHCRSTVAVDGCAVSVDMSLCVRGALVGSIDDSGELTSYRNALLGFLIGIVGMGVWLWQAGLPGWTVPLLLLAALVVFTGLTNATPVALAIGFGVFQV